MIFIGGTGRSGTTVLSQMFQLDPRFAVFIEPRFLIDPGGLLDYVNNNNVTQEQVVRAIATKFRLKMVKNMERFGVLDYAHKVYTEGRILKIARQVQRRTTDPVEFARHLTIELLSFAHPILGTCEIVEKTPHTIIYASQIREIFRTAYFIHIIRDPLDICSSVVKRSWGPRQVSEFSRWYNSLMTQAWEEMQYIPESRYVTVSLERMVDHPGETFTALCRRTGQLSPQPTILDAVAITCDRKKAHIGRCKRDLTPSDAQDIYENCNTEYQRWLGQAIE